MNIVVSKPKSAIMIAVLFIFIVSFSGCTNESAVDDVESSGGTEGLVAEFMAGAPPEQVAEDENFEVSVKLDNKGEYSVQPEDVAIFLLGVSPSSVGLDYVMIDSENCGDCLQDEIISAHFINEEWIPGGYDYVTWPTDGSGLEYGVSITSDQLLNFVAQNCYYYETIVSADACFSDNAYAQTTGAETCDISGEKNVANSGSPIHVTKVVENPAGKNKYTFTFYVQNVGEGRAFSPNAELADCTSLTQSQLDRVHIADVRVGGESGAESMNCIGKNILLVDGEGQFTCRVAREDVVGDYSDIMEVILRYGYYEQVNKEVVVKNIFDEL